MKKILSILIISAFTITCANAASINKAISDSGVNKGGVAVSVKEVTTGNVLYELNSDKPVCPASTLKAITIAASLNELGEDYNFKTGLYKTNNNELILKLGADPFLKSGDLRKLLKSAKEKNIVSPKAIYIDDSVLDNIEWGEGWQWDDDLNPLMPKFSSYNLDKNLLKVTVAPTVKGAPAEIKLDVFYPTTFMNLVTTGSENNIKISRNNNIAPDVLTIEGTIAKQIQKEIPINHLKRYFRLRLEDAIRSEKLDYYGAITNKKLPESNIYLVDEISTPIDDAVEEIMKNSSNMIAETLFKLAGGHYSKTSGSAEKAVEMFLNYCKKIGVDTKNIRIVDGSGVSKNNLVTADFMTSFLIAQYNIDNNYKNIFASAGEGTLKNRMLYFGDKLKAKTGTHCDVSSITGYIITLSGKLIAFDIMINDTKLNTSEKKMLEEYILRAIQTSY